MSEVEDDEEAWTPEKLRSLAQEALEEHRRGRIPSLTRFRGAGIRAGSLLQQACWRPDTQGVV